MTFVTPKIERFSRISANQLCLVQNVEWAEKPKPMGFPPQNTRSSQFFTPSFSSPFLRHLHACPLRSTSPVVPFPSFDWLVLPRVKSIPKIYHISVDDVTKDPHLHPGTVNYTSEKMPSMKFSEHPLRLRLVLQLFHASIHQKETSLSITSTENHKGGLLTQGNPVFLPSVWSTNPEIILKSP